MEGITIILKLNHLKPKAIWRAVCFRVSVRRAQTQGSAAQMGKAASRPFARAASRRQHHGD